MKLRQELRQVKRIIFDYYKDYIFANCKDFPEDFFSVNFGSYQFVPIDDLTIYKGEHIMALQGHSYNIYLCGSPSLGLLNEIENDVREKLRRYWAGGEKL